MRSRASDAGRRSEHARRLDSRAGRARIAGLGLFGQERKGGLDALADVLGIGET